MPHSYAPGLSSDAIEIYQLLAKKGSLDAVRIAKALHILPHAVYRLTNHLSQIGLIEENHTRPKLFRAKNLSQSRENYVAYQRSWFDEITGGIDEKENTREDKTSEFQISFIQGREEIFAQCAKDLTQAKIEAKFIVLGLQVGISPELLLEQRNAAMRGVPVKIIAQEYDEKNKTVLKAWKQAGLDVRYGQQIGFHLLLIDDHISYLMTYDSKDKLKRYAVRIIHQPINQQLQIIFDKHWGKATKL